MILVAIPIKSFSSAKSRLAPAIDAATRSRLGKAIAAKTAATATSAGAQVVVVTADIEVATWTEENEIGLLYEEESMPPGLDRAATTAIRYAAGMELPWAIIHGDLILATIADLDHVFKATSTGPVLVPSYDGGSNVVTGRDDGFKFSFGPGSFQRHFSQIPTAHVLTPLRLVLDLDTPRDLALARAEKDGRWLDDLLD